MSKNVPKIRGSEYAANIINARIGDGTPFRFNANLLNNGSVENLPYDACVEIPVVSNKNGYTREKQIKLPTAPALLVSLTAGIENLIVDAAMNKSKELVYQAVSLDPLCSAVLSLEEVRQMCDELFVYNKDYLGDYR
jgi:alpha-galactosidase